MSISGALAEVCKYIPEDMQIINLCLVCKSWSTAIKHSNFLWYHRSLLRGWYVELPTEDDKKDYRKLYLIQLFETQRYMINISPTLTRWIDTILTLGQLPLFKSSLVTSHGDTFLHNLVKAILSLGDSRLYPFITRGKKIVNNSNVRGRTALHIACQGTNQQLIKSLLDIGADPNIPDKEERTPLFCVQSVAIAKLLLENGASPKVVYSATSAKLLQNCSPEVETFLSNKL